MKLRKTIIAFGIILLSLLMHLNIFQKDLIGVHLWRQSQTQINIQNFYRYDYNILNPRHNSFNGGKDNIMRMEFPIMQWSIASLYKIFGETILITRISMFLIGLLGVFGIFILFKEIFDNELIACLGSFLFNFSPVFYYYTMNPIPDVFALSSGLVSLGYFFKYYRHHSNSHIILSGVFMSFSILAKLPYILFGIIPFAYFIQEVMKGQSMNKNIISKLINVYLIALLPPLFWYGWVMKDWGTSTIVGGIINTPLTLQKMKEILGYHLMEMWPKILIGYPSLVLFLIGIFYTLKQKKGEIYWQFFGLMVGLFAYFLFELTLIGKEHDYYMMPFLLIFFTVVTYGVKKLFYNTFNLKPLLYLLIVLAPINAFFVIKKYWTTEMSYFDKTLLEDREMLRNIVPKNEKCIIINDKSNYVFSYLIDKQGFIFDNDYLPKEWIEDMIKNYDVKYMYSTSRIVDDAKEFIPYIDQIIYQKEKVKVIKLKLPQ